MIFFFFFHDTAATEIYTLSLHDALPIFLRALDPELAPALADDAVHRGEAEAGAPAPLLGRVERLEEVREDLGGDRKSTRLNSSHSQISYAVFCLKKKKRRSTQ